MILFSETKLRFCSRNTSPSEPPVTFQLLRDTTIGTYPKYQHFPDDEDRDGPRNVGLLAIRLTEAAASPNRFNRTVIKYVKFRRTLSKFLRFKLCSSIFTQQPPVGQGLLIHEVSRSHTTMH